MSLFFTNTCNSSMFIMIIQYNEEMVQAKNRAIFHINNIEL